MNESTKGKFFIDNSCFVVNYCREYIQFYSVIIAIVVDVIGLAVSIIAIFQNAVHLIVESVQHMLDERITVVGRLYNNCWTSAQQLMCG